MRLSRRDAIAALLGLAAVPRLSPASWAAPREPMIRPDRVRSLEPYEVRFPPEAIADLQRRIDSTRWPEMPFDTGWTAGTNDEVLRELTAYWRHEYDWFAVEREMNRLDHRRGPVGGEQLHCVVHAGAGAALPILLLHGWPSSFWEFHRGASQLARGVDGAPGFPLVVPSLPGFAFSEPPREPGMNPYRIAERLHLLMQELGYTRYGVHGGDWGAIIGTQLARRYPDAVVGLHVNFVAGAPQPPAGTEPSDAEVAYRAERTRFQAEETGYSSIQGTRPQSLAYAQQDSPVGWLAWILEKFWAWSDHGDDLWRTFTRDDLLTTAMLYWMPGRILSAARIYYETSYRPAPNPLGPGRVEVPTGYSRYPAEPWAPPREVVERSYNLVWYGEPARGGHFPALEQPDVWARQVAGFFGTLV